MVIISLYILDTNRTPAVCTVNAWRASAAHTDTQAQYH